MIDPMTHRVRRGFFSLICCATLALSGSTAHAQDEEELPDARLMGYTGANKPALGGGSALSYVLVGFLGVITVGVLFKNARRSHLD